MFYGSGGGGFELKSLQVYRVEVVIYFEDLDGYEIAYLPTAGAVDIGHSAFADQIFEFVFAFQDAAYQQISTRMRSEEHTSELQSQSNLVCRLLLEKKKEKQRWRTGRSNWRS